MYVAIFDIADGSWCHALCLLYVYSRFQAEVSAEVAQIYNYRSPLEHFSASCALAMADEIGLFSSMPKKIAKQTRLEIIDLVLATDMSSHFDLVSSFGAIVAAKHAESVISHFEQVDSDDSEVPSSQSLFTEKYETRMLVLKIAIKLSDLGHCFLSWEEHMAWCERLEAEFFSQGDAEVEASIDISPLMDRRRPGVSNHGNSEGFFQTFVIPMLKLWVEMYPNCNPVLEQAQSNLKNHQKWTRPRPASMPLDMFCRITSPASNVPVSYSQSTA